MTLIRGLCLTSMFAFKALADPYSTWLVPPPAGSPEAYRLNLVWTLGSQQTIIFNTSLDSWDVVLWQQLGNINATPIATISTSAAGPGTHSFAWTVSVGAADLDISPVFFLWFAYHTLGNVGVSHYFNISATAVASGSSSGGVSTGIVGVVASTSATSVTPSSTSVTPSSTSATPPGPNNDVTITVGLGVGRGVGIPLVLLAAGLLVFKIITERRRNALQPSAETAGLPPAPNQPLEEMYAHANPDHNNTAPRLGLAAPKASSVHSSATLFAELPNEKYA